MVRVYTPPLPIRESRYGPRLFLAGSIEMGKATEWQNEAIRLLRLESSNRGRITGRDISVFNPRRPDWDSTWEQKYENPPFFQQVTWELDAIHWATDVLFYFEEGTQAPITLLELGEVPKDKRIYVVCPDGYWRKGNVDIYCERYKIPVYHTLHTALDRFVENIKS